MEEKTKKKPTIKGLLKALLVVLLILVIISLIIIWGGKGNKKDIINREIPITECTAQTILRSIDPVPLYL